MKLNLGCGYNKLDGYVNVDSDPNCEPDTLADIEDSLPFEDNSVDEIVLNHVLEHLGQTTKVYFHVWKEMYRVLKDGALVLINVPHHNHDNFHHDATHVRKVTPLGRWSGVNTWSPNWHRCSSLGCWVRLDAMVS